MTIDWQRDPRAFLSELFTLAVAAADPMKVIGPNLPERPKGRLIVIGAGKASARMAEAVEAHYGPCNGLVITRYGYARPCQSIEIVEASHPVPDQAGKDATVRMLDLVSDLSEDDLVLCLISGGGSALLCAPSEGLTLQDKMTVNQALLDSGAPIGDMNIVRKHLSRVKGGQLAAACAPAQVHCLMISDVPGDNPAEIASGPTVGENSTPSDAKAILDRWKIALPQHVEAALQASSVVPMDDPRLAKCENHIAAAPSASLNAAAMQAKELGLEVKILGTDLEGEARELGVAHADEALRLQTTLSSGDAPLLLLSGGECTVTRRGNGIGGPNAEYALAALGKLDGQPGIHLIACDTDGVDGAAEVAGAYIGPQSVAQAKHAGVSIDKALAENDAHRFFEALGDQIVTGPTLTNVNDFRAILIFPPQ